MQNPTNGMTYRQAGVDIDAGNALVQRIKPAVARTERPGVMGTIGGFGGLFDLAATGLVDPILVSGADGVGTKLKLAIQLDRHDSIGIDLVAMCVNDVLVQGAQPLFFLDYYASAALDVDVAVSVVAGIAEGCRQAGCALLGGETAEMPGLYQRGDYDLAGFCVGAVERKHLLTGQSICAGDAILGIAASGPHANGFSLIRQILDTQSVDMGTPLDGKPLAEHLLAPTQIYVRGVLPLRRDLSIHGLVHITGGGLPENVVRVLPDGLSARIDPHAWPRPTLFHWLQKAGRLQEAELLRTFNCGIGMCIILPPDQLQQAQEQLADAGLGSWEIGTIVSSPGSQSVHLDPAR